jgi:hypothetical protein
MRNIFPLAVSNVTILLFATVLIAGGQQQGGTKPLSGYSSILVSNFEIDKTPATEDFPKGLERLMQSRTAKDLRERKVFAEVVDGSDTPVATSAGQESASKHLILSANIVSYDKGSRAARAWVGIGAGESRIKMRFTLRDAETNSVVLLFDQQNTFKGTNSVYGGNQDDASVKPAMTAIKQMIKTLETNR